jgi:hypothetical protein
LLLQFDKDIDLANHTVGRACQPGEEGGGWDDYFAGNSILQRLSREREKRARLLWTTIFNASAGVYVPWTQSVTRHPYYRKFRDGAIDESQPQER